MAEEAAAVAVAEEWAEAEAATEAAHAVEAVVAEVAHEDSESCMEIALYKLYDHSHTLKTRISL